MVEPESLLPLKPVELLILIVLERGERHGYGIRQDILEHTNGQVSIEAGNLYRHIRTLEDSGLLSTAAAPKQETDARRIYYRLEALGRRVLAAELRRLQALVRLGEKRGLIGRSRA
jgi:DNA-binding PadR family transcriptional regulator